MKLPRDRWFQIIFLLGAFNALFLSRLFLELIGGVFDGKVQLSSAAYPLLILSIGYMAWVLWGIPAFFKIGPLLKQRLCELSLALLLLFSVLGLPFITFIWPWYIWNVIILIFLFIKIEELRRVRGKI